MHVRERTVKSRCSFFIWTSHSVGQFVGSRSGSADRRVRSARIRDWSYLNDFEQQAVRLHCGARRPEHNCAVVRCRDRFDLVPKQAVDAAMRWPSRTSSPSATSAIQKPPSVE